MCTTEQGEVICLVSVIYIYIYSILHILIGERAKRARHSLVCSIENRGYIIGERAKRARHSLVCSIENRGYIYYILLFIPWLLR